MNSSLRISVGSLRRPFLEKVTQAPRLPNSWASRLASCRNALVLGTLLTGFITPNLVHACPCGTKPVLKKALDDAQQVFVGRVLDQRVSPLKPGFVEVKVTPLTRFKDQEGLNLETVTFYTPEDEAKCGVSFQPGYEYLVFLSGNPAFLKADSCSRTEVLENAQVDVHRLAKSKEQPLENTDPVATPTPDAKGKGKGGKKDLPPPRDALEEALRKRNLLSPDAVKNKSRL